MKKQNGANCEEIKQKNKRNKSVKKQNMTEVGQRKSRTIKKQNNEKQIYKKKQS